MANQFKRDGEYYEALKPFCKDEKELAIISCLAEGVSQRAAEGKRV